VLNTIGIPELANQTLSETGMDSAIYLGKSMREYPYAVSYRYNQRGFRDREWPQDLSEVIWCIGDSFTTGLGAPVEHTWWYQLEQIIKRRCINISLDGASNQWIARQAQTIQQELGPVPIVIMWSYLHRRENPASNLTDLQRRVWHAEYEDTQEFFEDGHDVQNWLDCYHATVGPRTIHSVIPDPMSWFNLPEKINRFWQSVRQDNWPQVPTTESDLVNLPKEVTQFLFKNYKKEIKELYESLPLLELHNKHGSIIDSLILVKQIDYSRDKHHFDIMTAQTTATIMNARLAATNRAPSLQEIVMMADLW
jgi:hypothetical protein